MNKNIFLQKINYLKTIDNYDEFVKEEEKLLYDLNVHYDEIIKCVFEIDNVTIYIIDYKLLPNNQLDVQWF